jgi:hypothetical protein
MPVRFFLVAMICGLTLIALPAASRCDDSKTQATKRVVIAGIYCDRKDNKGDILTFMADGDDEPQNYTLEGADKRTLEIMKAIFPMSRMRIAYKQDGDVRRIVGVEKIVSKSTGVFIGEVMFVKNNFWLAVKPRNGPPDAFALAFPAEKGGPIVDLMKSLKKGDVVAVKYNTDFERHRIVEMQKKGD